VAVGVQEGAEMSDQGPLPADVILLRSDDKPVLFISHRHDDRAIADVLRRFIEARTGGRVVVFQSSTSGARGPKQGENPGQRHDDVVFNGSDRE
jgi:hypothetical protein